MNAHNSRTSTVAGNLIDEETNTKTLQTIQNHERRKGTMSRTTPKQCLAAAAVQISLEQDKADTETSHDAPIPSSIAKHDDVQCVRPGLLLLKRQLRSRKVVVMLSSPNIDPLKGKVIRRGSIYNELRRRGLNEDSCARRQAIYAQLNDAIGFTLDDSK